MKRFAAVAVCLLFGNVALAQIAPPPLPAAPAAPPRTLWSFLGIDREKLRECRIRCCQTTAGQMANNMLAPIRLATGGLIPDCCPPVLSKEELDKLKAGDVSPAEEAAAKIKAEEAQAKARRAAVRYLGTVDCHYYPEAEAAIIAALRADRNECVRIEAAKALANGCCCTKKTVAALNIVVSGDDKDGNPSETSERVKICAFEALERCIAFGADLPVPVPPELPLPTPAPPELPRSAPLPLTGASATPSLGSLVPARYESPARVYAETVSAVPPPRLQTGSRSLVDVLSATIRPAADERQTRTPSPTTAQVETPRPTTLRGPDALTPIGVVPQ